MVSLSANLNNLPLSVLGSILIFDPKNTHQLETVSKKWLCASKDPSFTHPYFQELITSLGLERLNQLFGRANWVISRVSLNELTQKVYQYAHTTSFGRELLKGKHEILAASQLADIVKLRDQEEDTNLVKIAPRLFRDIDAIYASIAYSGKTEGEILSLRAQAIRKEIITIPDRDRDNLLALHLRDLELTSIPKEIFTFKNLKILKLNGNKLSTLPAEINSLSNLKRLDLSDNQFTAFPVELVGSVNLEYLYLDDNKLSALPAQILRLVNLLWLTLRGNQFRSFPTEVNNLVKLEKIDLSNNPLMNPPVEIDNLDRKEA